MPGKLWLNNSCPMRTGGVFFRRMALLIGTTPLLWLISLDISALIQPPDVRRFGAELWAVLHMLDTATLWLCSADPSSIPPEAQELVWNNLLALLSSAERFAPSNKAGTFNVPPAPLAASGSASTGSAGQSNRGAMGDASSSKRQRHQRH